MKWEEFKRNSRILLGTRAGKVALFGGLLVVQMSACLYLYKEHFMPRYEEKMRVQEDVGKACLELHNPYVSLSQAEGIIRSTQQELSLKYSEYEHEALMRIQKVCPKPLVKARRKSQWVRSYLCANEKERLLRLRSDLEARALELESNWGTVALQHRSEEEIELLMGEFREAKKEMENINHQWRELEREIDTFRCDHLASGVLLWNTSTLREDGYFEFNPIEHGYR